MIDETKLNTFSMNFAVHLYDLLNSNNNPDVDSIRNESKVMFDILNKKIDEHELKLKNLELTPGPRGQIGHKGDKGDIGLCGKDGKEGQQGPQGVQGQNGSQGQTGSQGQCGLQGPQGEKGNIGIRGEQGEIGRKGTNGEQGDEGIQGVQGIHGNNANIEDVVETIMDILNRTADVLKGQNVNKEVEKGIAYTFEDLIKQFKMTDSQESRDIFSVIDTNGDGFLTETEIEYFLSMVGEKSISTSDTPKTQV